MPKSFTSFEMAVTWLCRRFGKAGSNLCHGIGRSDCPYPDCIGNGSYAKAEKTADESLRITWRCALKNWFETHGPCYQESQVSSAKPSIMKRCERTLLER